MGTVQTAMSHWQHVAPLLSAPTTESKYEKLVDNLDAVLDAGGANESNSLAGLAV